MHLTEEQEKVRKIYVKTLKGLHVGVKVVHVDASKIVDILGYDVCDSNDLFPYVMETSLEYHASKRNSTTVLKQTASLQVIGLAPVNPQLLLKLMEEAGK